MQGDSTKSRTVEDVWFLVPNIPGLFVKKNLHNPASSLPLSSKSYETGIFPQSAQFFLSPTPCPLLGGLVFQRAHPHDPHDPGPSIKREVICPAWSVFDQLTEWIPKSSRGHCVSGLTLRSEGMSLQSSIQYRINHCVYELRKRVLLPAEPEVKPQLSQLEFKNLRQ